MDRSYVKAINLYEQVYQRNPKNIQGETAYFNLGVANYYLGDNLWYADVWEFRIDHIEEVVGDGFIINCSSENLVEGKKMNDTRFKKHIVFINEEISEYLAIRRDQNLKNLGI